MAKVLKLYILLILHIVLNRQKNFVQKFTYKIIKTHTINMFTNKIFIQREKISYTYT